MESGDKIVVDNADYFKEDILSSEW